MGIPTLWRDEFMVQATRAGLRLDQARTFLRYAATLDRLACARCNGDWPADNGERKVATCPKCESGWVKSSFRKGVCPDCRAEQLTRAALPAGWTAETAGDPRGCVLTLISPAGVSIGVPSRT